MASVQDCTVQVFQGVVCGLALQNMKQEESDRKGIELVRLSADCQAQYHELMELFENPDFCQAVSKRDIGLVGAGLMLIVTITRPITQQLRAELSDVSDPYRPALAAILPDIDASVDRLVEILEAWSIALD